MKKSILKNISIICAICLIVCMAGGFTSGSGPSVRADAVSLGSTEVLSVVAESTSAAAPEEAASGTVPMYINGIKMTDGIKVEDTTYVPLKAFFKVIAYQTDIVWNADTNTVTVTGKDLVLTATVGENYMTVNDRCFYLPCGVTVINSSLCLPVRELAKVFNAAVTWDSETSSVNISVDDPAVIESGEKYYNEEDLFWLSRLINAESGNQSLEGKIGVGNVVLNRVADPSCPDTVYGVIFDTKYGVQFSVTQNGTINDEPNEESVIAAKICLEGYNIVGDSIYFVNPQVGISSWFARTRLFVVNIGEHDFYA